MSVDGDHSPAAARAGAVHGAGVLHRDVKSHNVVIDERGSELRVVLTDFGLARSLDARQRALAEPSSDSLA